MSSIFVKNNSRARAVVKYRGDGSICTNSSKYIGDGSICTEEVFVIGHSLSEVDYPYFEEICKKCKAKWYIGYHSYDDMKRLVDFVKHLGLKDVTVFRT